MQLIYQLVEWEKKLAGESDTTLHASHKRSSDEMEMDEFLSAGESSDLSSTSPTTSNTSSMDSRLSTPAGSSHNDAIAAAHPPVSIVDGNLLSPSLQETLVITPSLGEMLYQKATQSKTALPNSTGFPVNSATTTSSLAFGLPQSTMDRYLAQEQTNQGLVARSYHNSQL